MFRYPPVEVMGSIRVSASLFYGISDHTHPSGKVRRRNLEVIKRHGLLITCAHEEVEFGEDRQSVGSQGLAGLVDKTGVVPYLHSNENTCRRNKCSGCAHSGSDQAGINHVELLIIMLKTEIDIVNFTPVPCNYVRRDARG